VHERPHLPPSMPAGRARPSRSVASLDSCAHPELPMTGRSTLDHHAIPPVGLYRGTATAGVSCGTGGSGEDTGEAWNTWIMSAAKRREAAIRAAGVLAWMPSLAMVMRRNCPQQPDLAEFGQPYRVTDVGPTTRDVLHVMGVAECGARDDFKELISALVAATPSTYPGAGSSVTLSFGHRVPSAFDVSERRRYQFHPSPSAPPGHDLSHAAVNARRGLSRRCSVAAVLNGLDAIDWATLHGAYGSRARCPT
jgi:hypothetical protein